MTTENKTCLRCGIHTNWAKGSKLCAECRIRDIVYPTHTIQERKRKCSVCGIRLYSEDRYEVCSECEEWGW